jgi:hypothetical protein
VRRPSRRQRASAATWPHVALLEREAIVVVHPLVGYRDTRTFAIDTGRLYMALSRHRAHATILVDSSTDAVLQQAQVGAPDDATLARHRYVLSALLTTV